MAITQNQDQYQIPRGEVFFDPFDTNGNRTGERPFGNCPGMTVTIESEKAEHYSSRRGLREKDAAVTIQVNRTGNLTCDNMSAENVALFLAGSEEMVSQTDDSVTDEPINGVLQGRHYQLGQSTSNPAGARDVSSVVVEDDSTPTPVVFVLGEDYEVDLAMGRLHILPGGDITNGTNLRVSYNKTVKTWRRIKTGAESELRGALRIISDNASGEDRDWYMPSVTLTPTGEIPIIAEGTDFASMGFSVEILKPANGEAIYVDGRPAAA